MGRYLDIARKVSEGQATPPVSQGVEVGGDCEKSEISEKSPEHRRLLAAGWKPKARCGEVIWASPQSGFWYCQEVALEVLRLDERPPYK